jgi:hypothetical protein
MNFTKYLIWFYMYLLVHSKLNLTFIGVLTSGVSRIPARKTCPIAIGMIWRINLIITNEMRRKEKSIVSKILWSLEIQKRLVSYPTFVLGYISMIYRSENTQHQYNPVCFKNHNWAQQENVFIITGQLKKTTPEKYSWYVWAAIHVCVEGKSFTI